MQNRVRLICVLVAMATNYAPRVHAESTVNADNSASDNGLEEILVTAERRSSNLQTSAVAASVLTGSELAAKGVTDVDQLQFVMPNVTIQNFGQGNAFNVRGIGKTEPSSGTAVGVITYRDGIATFPGYLQTEPYYDIASVELLRGPQGTFAGQNATGGAVFITEVNPTLDAMHGYIQGQYGNYNDGRIQGAINIPLSSTFATRIAFNSEARESFYQISGPFTGSPGRLRSNSARISFLWQPTEALTILSKTDYNDIDQGGYPADPANATNNIFRITNNADNQAKDRSLRSVLNISYVLPGGITLRSISGLQNGNTLQAADLDGTSALNFTFRDNVHEKIYSEELNVVSPDGHPFNWVAGVYYQNDKTVFPPNDFDTGEPPGALDITLQGENPKTTKAVFGQVGYDLTPALQLQVGLRYSKSTNRNNGISAIPEFGLFLPQDAEESDSATTGKVALNWTLDANNFLYAFVATGHKAGGLNGVNILQAQPKTFQPEKVTDYELGWKSTLLDNHLRTQAGVFYNKYENFQISLADPNVPGITSIVNVPDSTKIYGLELSAQAVFGDLSFDGGASYLHSKLGTLYAGDARLGQAGGNCALGSGPASAACQDLSGVQQTYSPEWTLNAGVQYMFHLGSLGTLTPRASYSHIAPAWATLFENYALGDRLTARDILNAQAEYAIASWRVTAYSTNLNNLQYVAAINNNLRYAGPPRQYGIRVQYDF
jgi:iron complex outermembrane receptor protein